MAVLAIALLLAARVIAIGAMTAAASLALV